MRIATLQFSPALGDVARNLARADALIAEAGLRAGEVDVLVGPELGFSGYNFPSLAHITPYLEPTAAGPTARWAFATAKRLACVVSVGYPERASPPNPPPASNSHIPLSAPTNARVNETENGEEEDGDGVSRPGGKEHDGGNGIGNGGGSMEEGEGIYNYNTTLTVGPTGEILAHYRKTHLYYTDETWALPSPSGWLSAELPLPLHRPPTAPSTASPSPPSNGTAPPLPSSSPAAPSPPSTATASATSTAAPPPTTLHPHPHPQTITTAFGICMDLNPHLFRAPWTAYEFATHARAARARLVLCSMAWLSRLSAEELGLFPPTRSPRTTRPPPVADGEYPTSHSVPHTKDESGDDDIGELARSRTSHDPDTATLTYWLARLAPLIAAPAVTVVVIANRCGIEPGGWRDPHRFPPTPTACSPPLASSSPPSSSRSRVRPDFRKCARFGGLEGEEEREEGEERKEERKEGEEKREEGEEARYAGTSCVLRVGAGRVEVVGVMGRGVEGVGVVDVEVGVDG